MVAVRDEEILEAMGLLARETGVFGEPAGVTGFAGFLKALSDKMIGSKERVVIVVTGSGLKDVEAALRAAPKPREIEPNLEAVAREIGGAI
jgi:threonine synthase